jgi:hypothetical protein
VVLRYVAPREIFGVAPAIGLSRYPATATAVDDTVVLRLAAGFSAACRQHIAERGQDEGANRHIACPEASGAAHAPLRPLVRSAQERQQTTARERAEDVDHDREHGERRSGLDAKEGNGYDFEILHSEDQRCEGEKNDYAQIDPAHGPSPSALSHALNRDRVNLPSAVQSATPAIIAANSTPIVRPLVEIDQAQFGEGITHSSNRFIRDEESGRTQRAKQGIRAWRRGFAAKIDQVQYYLHKLGSGFCSISNQSGECSRRGF